MEDKLALITGSSRGIGRDIALKLADRIAGVAVHFHKNDLAAREVVQKIKQKGKHALAFQADLTTEQEAISLVQRAEKELGRIDILVNNFGPIRIKNWEKLSFQEWDYTLHANLSSAWFCMKNALPGMRKRKWGRVINLGYSRAEHLGAFKTIMPYAIAKTGLLILTRTSAVSEAAYGVTVNMVSPGLMQGGIMPEDKSIPCGRLGRFEDVSQAVLFLASEEANFITGNHLIVAGGWKL